MKIIWICHFTNDEIQNSLPLWKKRNEFSSWIPNLLKGFESRMDIELHVISPHEHLKKCTNFKVRNINYYFVPYGIPIWHRHWPSFSRYDLYSNFSFFRRKVKKMVKEIQPDIINLIGTENINYSFSVFDFKNTYPILITIQGFISQFKDYAKLTREIRKRIEIEEQILKNYKYFSGEQDSSNYILSYNSIHVFFKFYFPVNEYLVNLTKDMGKRYDCIYFGKLSKIKGTEDFIKVIAILKQTIPDIKACIIGGGDSSQFIAIAKRLKCIDQIEFTGFLKTQKELFECVKSSRVFLAPPYKERLSSTIRETMLLKVPIVAYATGGIPYINEFDENIYLVETGNYTEMAKKTLFLLQNDILREQLAEKAYLYAKSEYSLEKNVQRLISAYQTIIKKN
jgi:glycosyltransferase involved in cell wall biosynthesis